MSTKTEFRDYVLEMFRCLDGIVCKPMMGEYLLYYQGVLFGGIYDNRVLIKIVEANKKFGLSEELPYKGAKMMFMIEDLENMELLQEIVKTTFDALKK
ncbi:MAG: hypothetical protein K2K31_00955 [Clostridia bacterium]|nr:hypothetical protein [Clostridia bacterium]